MNGAPRKEPELPVALGTVVANKYRLDRVLGWGGMGVVAVATHMELGQRVALKFLLPRALQEDEARQRFLREARAVVRLRSEHVARVFDVGALPTGEPYTVMEYLEGSDLAAHAKANAPLRVADAVEFVLQACEAIVEAHALGIVHRDLKPHNLFVTRRVNGAPLVKVLDFGISKELAPFGSADLSLTDSTVVLGSPLYMAPEQMKSARSADARSDIWSLGVILYELLTGRVPFDGESMTELCLKVVNEPPPPPRELRAELPADLAAVVLRCLEKDPDRRYGNVAKLAEALEGFSVSGRHNGTDRAWRSLVDTADAQDVNLPTSSNAPPPVAAPPPTHARTDVTWGDALRSAPPPSKRQRRMFLGGLSAGVVVTILIGAAAFLALRARAGASDATPTLAAAPPPSVAAAPATEPSAPAAKNVQTPLASASIATADPSAPPSASAASPAPRPAGKGHARVSPRPRSETTNKTAPHPLAPTAAPTPALPPTAANGAPILH